MFVSLCDHYILLETRLHWQWPSINQDSHRFQEQPPSRLFTNELKKWSSQLSEEEIAEFLTKTEQKKCQTTQNILLGGCYLLCKEYLEEKLFYILKPRREIGQSLEESLPGSKLVNPLRPAHFFTSYSA